MTATFITIINILDIKYLHLRYKLDKLCYVVLYSMYSRLIIYILSKTVDDNALQLFMRTMWRPRYCGHAGRRCMPGRAVTFRGVLRLPSLRSYRSRSPPLLALEFGAG